MNRLRRTTQTAVLGLFVLLTASCGSDDEAPVQESDMDTGTDTDPDSNTGSSSTGHCAVESRVGDFHINLSSGDSRTIIGGSVSDGVVPSSIPEVIQTSGTCRIIDSRHLFCDPTCESSDVTCGEEGVCIPMPLNHSVGTVTVAGMKQDVTMEPNAVDSSYYRALADPYPSFEEGDRLTLSAAGDVFGAFSLFAVGVAPLQMASKEVLVDRDTPVTLAWETPETSDASHIHIQLVVNAHGVSTGEITCEAPDTGSFSIPADIVTALIDRGLSGYPKMEVARHSVASREIEPGCVELVIASSSSLPVQVAGLISCEGDDDCPDDQVCNNDTLMCE